MKTYLMDSFNRYKRFSEKLDVKAILCNKSWWVFNDSGEKEIYIFQENGSLIISLNGNVTNANWMYLPANQSLVINAKEQSYMLHPAFLDEKIFALQKDGTEQYSFMIMEGQLQSFWPKSLSDLNLYFEQKRLAEIEEERKALEADRIRKLEEEKERRKAIKLEKLKEKEKEEEKRINKLCWKNRNYIIFTALEIFIFPSGLFFILSPIWFPNSPLAFLYEIENILIQGLIFMIITALLLFVVIFLVQYIEYKKDKIRNNVKFLKR